MHHLVQSALALASLMCALVPAGALARAAWSSKAITRIVPFAPGGSTDVTDRVLAAQWEDELGQPVVVENRGGAGSNLGGGMAARAVPDRHTLVLATSTRFTSIGLDKRLAYDCHKDFIPVRQVALIPNALATNARVPAHDLTMYLDDVRDPRNEMRYGSEGQGSRLGTAAQFRDSIAKEVPVWKRLVELPRATANRT